MGNRDHRAAPRDLLDIGVDDGLAVGIERAGRLVENEDARIEDQGARDRQALPLPAGQVGRAFVDIGVVAARQTVDEFLGARHPRGAHDVVEGRISFGGGDVLADRAAEQEVFLQDHADAAAQMRNIVFADVDAVDLDQALVIRMKALQQARDGRLARTAAPHDAQRRADGNLERDAIERGRQRALVGEAHIAELDLALQRPADAAVAVTLFLGLVDELSDDVDRDADLVILVDELRQLHQRARHPLRQHQKGEQRADERGIRGGQRQIDADGERPGDGQPLQRTHSGLDHRHQPAGTFLRRGHAADMHVPHLPLAAFERERLHRANAGEGLVHEGAALGLAMDHFAGRSPDRRQQSEQPHHDQAAETQHDDVISGLNMNITGRKNSRTIESSTVPNNWPAMKSRIFQSSCTSCMVLPIWVRSK